MDSTSQGDFNSTVRDQVEEDIFAAMGAADIPDEEKGALLARMMDLVQSRALLKIVDGLNDADKQELETIIDADENEGSDPNKLEKFLIEKVPQYEQIFLDEAKKLRQELTIEFAE